MIELYKFEEALVSFEKVIGINKSKIAESWHGKGLAENGLGNNDAAEKSFAKAKELGYKG